MKYLKSQMKQLIKDNQELQGKLNGLMKEHSLEKTLLLKLYTMQKWLKAGNISLPIKH